MESGCIMGRTFAESPQLTSSRQPEEKSWHEQRPELMQEGGEEVVLGHGFQQELHLHSCSDLSGQLLESAPVLSLVQPKQIAPSQEIEPLTD